MEKYVFSAQKELIPSDQIADPINVLNLITLIIAIIISFLLFRIT